MLDGCAVDIEYGFEVDKNAPGTKVDVALTIYWEKKEADPAGCVGGDFRENTDMHYFMRAKIGNDNLTRFSSSQEFERNYNYIFAGVMHDVCYLDWDAQKLEIQTFIYNTVVPELFAGKIVTPDDVKVKSIDNLVEDQNSRFPGCCQEVFPDGTGTEIYFMMMDLVLAVQ